MALDDLRSTYEGLREVEYQRADYYGHMAPPAPGELVEMVAIESRLAELGIRLADQLADIMGWNGAPD